MTNPALDKTWIAPNYSDGETENQLLELFQVSSSCETKIGKILSENPSWPLVYHLSPIRENLLSWYKFNNQASLLEIGAGCGALTGLFCKKTKKVTAVELTELRKQIIFERHKDKTNLEVLAGNIVDINFKQCFDYVTCIGVLEYAGRYTNYTNPYHDFIKLLVSFLNPGGKFILAIENQLGLKYWNGAKEDHTGRIFESLENYPHTNDIKTFGKNELSALLSSTGLNDLQFYYPLPDYKLPFEIFSDNYLPSSKHQIKSGLIPAQDYVSQRSYFFDEIRVLDNIINNNCFPLFANSFLVFGTKSL